MGIPKLIRFGTLNKSVLKVNRWLDEKEKFLAIDKLKSKMLPTLNVLRPIMPSWPKGASRLNVFVVVRSKGCRRSPVTTRPEVVFSRSVKFPS